MPRNRARAFFSLHSLPSTALPSRLHDLATSLEDDWNWNRQTLLGSAIYVRTKGLDADAAGWPGYSQGANREGSNLDVIAELRNPATLGAGELYDTLIITERPDLLESLRWSNTVGHLRHFHDRLIEGNAEAGTLLYQVWPGITLEASAAWVTHVRSELYAWECTAAKVNLTIEADGRTDRVGVLPAGLALAELVERALAGELPGITGTAQERLDAIFADSSHLTELGVHFIAAVHYGAIFGKSAVGAAAHASVPAEALAAVQQIAWDTVSTYYATPTPWQRSMEDCRTQVAADVCPSYRNLMGEPGQVAACSFWAEAEAEFNPFRWPDASWAPLPAPE